MPWGASEASSRAAQQRMSQQHGSQYERFRRQGQQHAARQMSDMMEQSRVSRRRRRREAPPISKINLRETGDHLPYGNGRGRGRRMQMILAAALATCFFVLACVVTVAAVSGTSSPDTTRTSRTLTSLTPPVVTSPTIAGVVLAEAWNVRSGPSVQSPAVGTVESGEAVSVICVSDGWAKLQNPFVGNFIYIDGLSLAGKPPQC